MGSPWNSPPEEPSPTLQPSDFDPFLLGFDPDEWLVDPHRFFVSVEEVEVLDFLDSPVTEISNLGVKEELPLPSIDETMKCVTLLEDSNEKPVNNGTASVKSSFDDAKVAFGNLDLDGSQGRVENDFSETTKANGASEDRASFLVNVANMSSEENCEAESDGSDEEIEESESSDSSSSSSSSEEEDSDDGYHEGKHSRCDSNISGGFLKGAEEEIEEGEIRDDNQDEMIIGSEEDEDIVKGPIRSKNEVEDLPPVPKIDVTLEPHHRVLSVGVISAVLDNKVVVNGLEKHNPLSEGSILWITEMRLPLGLVDEIFGPVKNPFYVIRYNSVKEIPAGISVGTAVSFVLEFATCILNYIELHKKSYDASGENDEELHDEVEFSDDEKEAWYKKSSRHAKRGNNNKCKAHPESFGNKRNFKCASMQKGMCLQVDQVSECPDRFPFSVTGPTESHIVANTFACSNYGSSGAGGSGVSSHAILASTPMPVQMSSLLGGAGGSGVSSHAILASTPMPVQMSSLLGGAGGSGVSSHAILASTPMPVQMSNSLSGAGGSGVSSHAIPAATPMPLQMSSLMGIPHQFQQLLNSVWLSGFLNLQQQSLGAQGFAANMLPSQQPGNHAWTQLHQSQAYSSFPSKLPFQHQLITNFQAHASIPRFDEPNLCTTSATIPIQELSGNIQEPSVPNQQNFGFPFGPTARGDVRPSHLGRGRKSFGGRKPHGRGGYHSYGRGGEQNKR
ncbi:uncharacterized protein LOC121968718 isoform X1 [Zingiber officinale]|uniref:H/ACA ribonucleoprotein complex non-core subunit NAF1 n=1 Tax=Zingiber officinale TaxID=94328 RepID=A0A8J5IC68_ZINOF|nr:uncharacterized protein LOC121968718 isoform X1 [Zingiber officinale]KAG6532351.1 hypothetical protein ZIOFF_006191 [Zingiber officinale]